jgi:tetrahydromethanopterin S-methyltransferase subunit B
MSSTALAASGSDDIVVVDVDDIAEQGVSSAAA